MEGYINENRWIDLSGLPRNKNSQINWNNSIGYTCEFMYNGTYGKITIVKRIKKNLYDTLINIGDNIKQHSFYTSNLLRCGLGNIIKDPVAITNPELIKYFVNTDDAYNYTSHSGKKVKMICPYCGETKWLEIYVLTRQGFSCPKCSDGISYPNKLMFNILSQLGVDFDREVGQNYQNFDWIGKYRYDFYVQSNEQKYFIEMDGKFHSFKEIQEIDSIKTDLANKHGIHIIRIDCQYSTMRDRFSFIKNNILNSEMPLLFDFSNVDWTAANLYSSGSYVKLVADHWNDGLSSISIAKTLKMSDEAIRTYLRIAAESNMCNYSIEESTKRMKINIKNAMKKCRKKPIAVYQNETLVGVFESGLDLSKQSDLIYGVHFGQTGISTACRGDRKQVHGYTMKFITREEYEQLCPQFNQQYKINGNNLKEVI